MDKRTVTYSGLFGSRLVGAEVVRARLQHWVVGGQAPGISVYAFMYSGRSIRRVVFLPVFFITKLSRLKIAYISAVE